MNFRVFTLLIATTLLCVQCASQKNNGGAWQKSIEESYYNIWSTGAAPAGTGANFFVKFNRTDKIEVTSFSVNNEALEFELIQTDTETLIIGRKFTGPDLEKQNQEMPAFYKQQQFSGSISISEAGNIATIQISSFEHRDLEQNHM